jgi:hypothetical protein
MDANPSKLNKTWHEKHRMLVKATLEQRIQWHLKHREHCRCRPIPAKLAETMKARVIL